MKIKALRMFSHYHLGNVSQGETRTVKKEIGEALVKMLLAEEIEPEKAETPDPEKPKTGGKGGNKRGADGADKGASQG